MSILDCGLPACPEHRALCAFHGDEPDRCRWCHATWTSILRRMAHGGRHGCETNPHALNGEKRRQRIAEARQVRLEAAQQPQDRHQSAHCTHRYADKGRVRWTLENPS